MKIDHKRQANKGEAELVVATTPKTKGFKELKSLDIGSNFQSNGTRSRGGYLIIKDQ